MISAMLCAMILSGPCDGGQCRVAILPRHVVRVEKKVTVEKTVVEGRVAARPHRIAKAAKVVLPPYRHKEK